MHHASIYATLLVLLGAIYLATRSRRTASSLPLPPGPKPLPIIGNVHQAPKSHPWRRYLEWSKEYGPIVHVNMLGQSVIVLSTNQAAHDLLAKRGSVFSDRPRLFLATELALKGLNILMMNYTDQFRQHQRLQVSVLNPTPVTAYLPVQCLESKLLLQHLLRKGGGAGTDVHVHFQRAVASVIHTLLYGFRVEDNQDPALTGAIQLNEEFSEFIKVGAHIVDMFPVLNNLPGFLAPWKAVAESHYERKHVLRLENFQRGLNAEGWNISKHLKATVRKENLEMPLDELAFELGTMIDAALDGTTDSLGWFVVACITQDQGFVAKAREELDNVVGRERLPVPEDRDNLPYITAIIEEVFRWRPVGPEGVPHLNNKETTYEGYKIPANSVIIPNVWTINRDESIYGPNVDDFLPERWLETVDVGKVLKAMPVAGFGYGRRLCPGRHFARNLIWIVIAQLLWSFDIEAGRSEDTGETLVVDPLACTDGLVMRALPFRAIFKPRGPWVQRVIDRESSMEDIDSTKVAMLDRIGAALSNV